MGLTIAGVTLPCPGRELVAWIAETIPVEEALPWVARSWPGVPASAAGICSASAPRMPSVLKVNRLWWPNGADRWAYGCYLCDGDGVSKIRDAANGPDGLTTTPIALSMDDGREDGDVLTASNMTLLQIKPLTSVPTDELGSGSNLYLLTLVDQRYWWGGHGGPYFGIPAYGASNESTSDGGTGVGGSGGTGPSWADLVAEVGRLLGVTIAMDPVSPDYLSPDPGLDSPGVPLGQVFEAIARNVGQRIVVGLDGSVKLQSYATALAARQADDSANPGRMLRAGGDLYGDEL